jgi:hypothetical protein
MTNIFIKIIRYIIRCFFYKLIKQKAFIKIEIFLSIRNSYLKKKKIIYLNENYQSSVYVLQNQSIETL